MHKHEDRWATQKRLLQSHSCPGTTRIKDGVSPGAGCMPLLRACPMPPQGHARSPFSQKGAFKDSLLQCESSHFVDTKSIGESLGFGPEGWGGDASSHATRSEARMS